MSPVRSGQYSRLWDEFQRTFSDFSGISVQAFDDKGNVFQSSPELPPLCAHLQRFPETAAACRKDCFRKASTCREACKILNARCYAGLSYRVVPMRQRGRPCAVILVGRVLSEVSGAEQYQGLIERYKLSRQGFLESLAGMRTLSGPELERAAAFVERLAFTFLATEARFQRHHQLLERRRAMVDLALRSSALADRSPGQVRGMLERLGGTLSLPALALLVEQGGRAVVETSIGMGEDVLAVLAAQDWPRLFDRHGRQSRVVLAGREDVLGAGFDLVEPPLVARRLEHGPETVGYLVAAGRKLEGSDLDFFEAAASFVAARIVHLQRVERAGLRDEESRLLGLMAEKCFTAHSLEELLPLALEAAMQSLHAKRGSILVAEEKGRIIAGALRGDHAPLSGTLKSLQPGTVSHEVFFNRRARLVEDIDREPGLKRERQFPYGSRSFVSVPLRENGQTLGVLHLTEREGEEAFSPRDLALLERLGRQASGAIRKAWLEQEVESLRITSTTDHLTGAHNRRFLEEQLGIELQRARRFEQPMAVAMLDVDDFKALNDELGHEYGDRVLKRVATAVREQLRAVDILARYGGDEFVLILPGTGAAGALSTVEKIRARIAATEIEGAQPRQGLSLSAGIAVFPDTVATAEDLLRRADEALYQAKKSGRNTAQLWIH